MHPPWPTSKLSTSMKPSQFPQAFPKTPTFCSVAYLSQAAFTLLTSVPPAKQPPGHEKPQ